MNGIAGLEEMQGRLDAFFAQELPGAEPRVANLVNLSVGRSRENWSFDLHWREGGTERGEPLMLRRDPLGGLVETDRGREFAILRALERTGVPAPAARWLDAEGRWFQRPSLIMRREPGTVDYYILNNAALPLEDRLRLAEGFCDLLAQVHLVRWRGTELETLFSDPGEGAAMAQMDQWEQVLRQDQLEPYPEIDLAVQWLRSTAPRSQATVLVHSDYKPGNVLVDGGRIGALLDWELAHLGDPIEDVGWITQPLRRREHMIEGSWGEEQILERYQRATGFAVDGDAIRWWHAFAGFRTAVMQVSGLRSFLEGRAQESYRPTARVLRSLLRATVLSGTGS